MGAPKLTLDTNVFLAYWKQEPNWGVADISQLPDVVTLYFAVWDPESDSA